MIQPRRWLREPLVHFLLLGALLFVANGLLGGGARGSDTILVTDAQVDSLIDRFQMQWRRPPTPEELRGLVDAHVREEALYREALAMGLDRDDTVVRRRMVQKLEFLSQDLVDENPSETELRDYFGANTERFLQPARISFAQVYLNPEAGDAEVRQRAASLLTELRGAPDRPLDGLGDSLLLETRFVDETAQGVASMFGSVFAAALSELPVGVWSGPVESGYGVHLVRVEARTEPQLPEFGAVRDRVRDEYIAQARREAEERLVQEVLARYRVVYEDEPR